MKSPAGEQEGEEGRWRTEWLLSDEMEGDVVQKFFGQSEQATHDDESQRQRRGTLYAQRRQRTT